MLTRLLTLSTFLAFASLAFADGDFSRTLTVSAQPDLYVSTGSGNVRIHSGSDDQIQIRAHVHAGWHLTGDVDARIARIIANPPISQNGNAVRIGDSQDPSLQKDISIEYEIAVPASAALTLRSGSGDLEVNQVGRSLAGTSGSGSIRAHGLHGPADLRTGSGDIELDQIASGEVQARTGSGSIRVRGFNGGLSAITGSGDIEANGHITGAGRLSTGSGSVRLHLSPDSRFDLGASTGSGTIRVNFPGAPQPADQARHHLAGPVNGGGPALDVHTGSGDIEISAT